MTYLNKPFFMVGPIEEVSEKALKLLATTAKDKKDDKKDDKKKEVKKTAVFKIDVNNVNSVVERLRKMEGRVQQKEKNPKYKYKYHPNLWEQWKTKSSQAETNLKAFVAK